jgi:hypothetical protein
MGATISTISMWKRPERWIRKKVAHTRTQYHLDQDHALTFLLP